MGEAGTPPTLVLPVDKTVTFKLHSPDVIHDFGVPGFLEKMDVIPGPKEDDNEFSVTPIVEGTYKGKCYELCGVYHSRMLFNVKIVSEADYQAYLLTLQAQGNVSDQPLLGGITSQTQAGLDRRRRLENDRHHAVDLRAPWRRPRRALGEPIVKVLTTTDHKVIGKLYLTTSFAWFLVAGVMALIMRSELANPGMQFVNDEVYNQLFTMHGTIMLLLFATPLFFGFGNVLMPLQIGSPDVAFPRLNMFSYWLFLFGGLIAASGFLTPAGAADFGWFAYTPLSDAVRSPSVGGDLWIMGLWMAGLGTILGAVNFITTIICMRAPGMTMFRMPIFVWNTMVTSLLVLIAFPVLAGALLSLEADRRLGAHVFDTSSRRPDPVAAPVLVLRPPRGLHHRAAVLRHRLRDHPGLQPQADLRLRRAGRRDARHRDPLGRGVGAPHVRHRQGRPAVLLRHDVPDRGSDRGQVLQLDRHDVGRIHIASTPPCSGRSGS